MTQEAAKVSSEVEEHDFDCGIDMGEIVQINFRISRGVKNAAERLARSKGYKSLPAYVHDLAIQEIAERQDEIHDSQRREIDEIAAENQYINDLLGRNTTK